MSRRTKQEAEHTRQLILDAAQQVFWKKGVSHTSLADIAEAAGVTRGAIYWHFQNKTDLITQLFQQVTPSFQAILETLEEDSQTNAERAIWHYSLSIFKLLTSSPQITKIIGILYSKCEYVGEMEQMGLNNPNTARHTHRYLERAFARAVQQGQLNTTQNVAVIASSLQSFHYGITIMWLKMPDLVQIPQHTGLLLTPFYQGVFHRQDWLP